PTPKPAPPPGPPRSQTAAGAAVRDGCRPPPPRTRTRTRAACGRPAGGGSRASRLRLAVRVEGVVHRRFELQLAGVVTAVESAKADRDRLQPGRLGRQILVAGDVSPVYDRRQPLQGGVPPPALEH